VSILTLTKASHLFEKHKSLSASYIGPLQVAGVFFSEKVSSTNYNTALIIWLTVFFSFAVAFAVGAL
jgi:hypothetical protein